MVQLFALFYWKASWSKPTITWLQLTEPKLKPGCTLFRQEMTMCINIFSTIRMTMCWTCTAYVRSTGQPRTLPLGQQPKLRQSILEPLSTTLMIEFELTKIQRVNDKLKSNTTCQETKPRPSFRSDACLSSKCLLAKSKIKIKSMPCEATCS